MNKTDIQDRSESGSVSQINGTEVKCGDCGIGEAFIVLSKPDADDVYACKFCGRLFTKEELI